MNREFVIWFLLVVLWWVFVGYGGQICEFGRARWCRHLFGRGSWVSSLV